MAAAQQPVQPVTTPTTTANDPNATPVDPNTQNSGPQQTAQADDDSSPKNDPAQNQQQAAIVSSTGNNPSAASTNAASPLSPSSPPATQGPPTAPGVRINNPLGSLASYTYQISLYMVSPDAYAQFASVRDITGLPGVALICQDGGVNLKDTPRAPGFQYDYYIDNVKFTTLATAKASGSETMNVNISFDIIEPYGFSFITNLRNAQDNIYSTPTTTATDNSSNTNRNNSNGTSTSTNGSNTTSAGPDNTPQNPTRGIFVIGIQFLGWNIDGTPATGQEPSGNTVLDKNGSTQGLFKTYYEFQISSFKFKLDGKPVIYNIEGALMPPTAMCGTKRGNQDSAISIDAKTVGDAINNYIAQLNSLEQGYVKNKQAEIANKFSVEYVGEGSDRIQNASIVSPADVDKSKWANSNVKKPADSNAATAQKATPNNTSRTISIGPGTNIVPAISQIISQSQYVLDAMKSVTTTSNEPNNNGGQQQVSKQNPIDLAWFNIQPVIVGPPKWDCIRGDWTFDTKFQIRQYTTPSVQVPAAGDNVTPYPGAYKVYNYWFTGENTEVINFDMQFDLSYFLGVVATDTTGPSSAAKGNNAPIAPGKNNNVNNQGKTGTGMNAPNQYRTYLYDPSATQEVYMTILGDPDWFMSVQPANNDDGSNKYYGPNGTGINPLTGQVFVEVNLLEAIDYDNTTGLMSLNDSIYFGPQPASIAGQVKGIPFQVIDVESTFQGGKFTQKLHLQGTQFPDNSAGDNNSTINRTDDSKANAQPSTSGPTPGSDSTSQNNGLTPAGDTSNCGPGTSPTNSPDGRSSPTPRTSNTGPNSSAVADDDAPGAGTLG